MLFRCDICNMPNSFIPILGGAGYALQVQGTVRYYIFPKKIKNSLSTIFIHKLLVGGSPSWSLKRGNSFKWKTCSSLSWVPTMHLSGGFCLIGSEQGEVNPISSNALWLTWGLHFKPQMTPVIFVGVFMLISSLRLQPNPLGILLASATKGDSQKFCQSSSGNIEHTRTNPTLGWFFSSFLKKRE